MEENFIENGALRFLGFGFVHAIKCESKVYNEVRYIFACNVMFPSEKVHVVPLHFLKLFEKGSPHLCDAEIPIVYTSSKPKSDRETYNGLKLSLSLLHIM